MNFDELKRFYSEHYSLGYLNLPATKEHSSFERKLILISLINHITYKTKLKNPSITHYEVIMKLSKNLGLPEEFLMGLAIVCEDFGYNESEFPTFGLQGQDMVKEIVLILKTYLPF